MQVLESKQEPAAKFHPTDGSLIALLDGRLIRIQPPEMHTETLASGLDSSGTPAISPDGKLIAMRQYRGREGRDLVTSTQVRSLLDGSLVLTRFDPPADRERCQNER